MNNIELQEISKLKAMEKFTIDYNTETTKKLMMNNYIEHEMKQYTTNNNNLFTLNENKKMIDRVLTVYHNHIIKNRLPYSKCYDAFMELDPYQLLSTEKEKDMIDAEVYNRVINEQQLKLCDLQVKFFIELRKSL